MAGVVAFAVADSAFAYLTEVNSYSGGSYLDTGWVAGYLLIALGALWATLSLRTDASGLSEFEDSTISIVAPYVPVLVVLAVTAFELVRGHHLDTISWLMVCAVAVLVLGREALHYLEGISPSGDDGFGVEVDDAGGYSNRGS
jgi:diguanylate cyclase